MLSVAVLAGIHARSSAGAAPRALFCEGAFVDPDEPGASSYILCENPCPAGCQTVDLIPISHEYAYTYCFCTSSGSTESRCCHAKVVHKNGRPILASAAGQCGSGCPGHGTCKVSSSHAGSSTYYSAKCVAY